MDDLSGRLSTLRSRTFYEVANNPILEGVIRTLKVDIVGAKGPALQVRSSNAAYNEKLEAGWRRWWAMPDDSGRMSGPDLLGMWIKMLCKSGEILVQTVTANSDDGFLSLRLRDIHPRRLDTPINKIGDNNVALGIESNERGQVVAYYVLDEQQMGAFTVQTGQAKRVVARNMVHVYEADEADQLRGFPWLASALDTIGELRDYDANTMDAARASADYAAFLEAVEPGVDFEEKSGTIEIERRTISTIPPGYRLSQLNPNQPPVTYKEFRRERLRDMGRPLLMPVMMILLDTTGHTYSSARVDSGIYKRGLGSIEGWLERNLLNAFVGKVAAEMRFVADAELRLPKAPPNVEYAWTWSKMPFVDPKKEAEAERIELLNGTKTLTDCLAERGMTLEEFIDKRKREVEMLEAAGLQTGPEVQGLSDDNAGGNDGAKDKAAIEEIVAESLEEAASIQT